MRHQIKRNELKSSLVTECGSILSILLVALALMVTACNSDDKKTTIRKAGGGDIRSAGGGEYGGGDALLEKATAEDIVNVLAKVKPVIKYNLQYLEMYLVAIANTSEEFRKEPESTLEENQDQGIKLPEKIDGYTIEYKHFKNLKEILFPSESGKETAYTLLDKINIQIEKDKPCYDEKGVARDGSIHTQNTGAICLSAQRLSQKVYRVHMFNTVLGLVLHEMVHRLGGNQVEAEAKIVEYIARHTPEAYSSLFFVYDLRKRLDDLSESLAYTLAQLKSEDDNTKARSIYDVKSDMENLIIKADQDIQAIETKLQKLRQDYDNLDKTAKYAFRPEQNPHQEAIRIIENQLQILKISIEQEEQNLEITKDYKKSIEESLASIVSSIQNLEMTEEEYKNFIQDSTCRNLQYLKMEADRVQKLGEQQNNAIPLTALKVNRILVPIAVLLQSSIFDSYCNVSLSEFIAEKFKNKEMLSLEDYLKSDDSEVPAWMFANTHMQIYKVEKGNKEQLRKALENLESISNALRSELPEAPAGYF